MYGSVCSSENYTKCASYTAQKLCPCSLRTTNLVNPIIIVVYRSAGPDKSADFVMNCC